LWARGPYWAWSSGPSTSPLVVMAQLIGLLSNAVLLSALVLYGYFVLRRFGGYGGPKPSGWRLGLLWFATLLGVAAIAAATLGAGHLFGVIYCSAVFSPNDAWPCSATARLLFFLACIGIGLPVLGFWLRFVNRALTHAARP
jgi:hypothetical protein